MHMHMHMSSSIAYTLVENRVQSKVLYIQGTYYSYLPTLMDGWMG